MSRLAAAVRLEWTLQVRQKFLHAAVFSGLIWLAVLLPMPAHLRPVAEPYVLLGDTAIIGFFFIAGTVFFDKQDRTLSAIAATPLRFAEYLTAKIAPLVGISLTVAVVVASSSTGGTRYHPLPLLAGVLLATLVMLLVGFTTSLPFASISDWFLAAMVPLSVMSLPTLHYSGVWPNPLCYLIPTQGPLLLFGAAFDRLTLAPWQIGYALIYPTLCIAGLSRVARKMFDHYVIERS